jgi:glucuronate isomerase
LGIHKGKENESPVYIEEKSKWDKYRPDILMVAGTDKRTTTLREADVVEIKVLPRYRPDHATEPGRKPT